ncbi:hypothetical protein G6F56_008422 [Rhizopus delemar]|nr:hypothetical protein G6F56_008422 [Rhizopus delemar]
MEYNDLFALFQEEEEEEEALLLNSTYTDEQFRRQFRMSRRLFLRVLEGIQRYHDYFEQKTDAAQRLGFSPIQKVSVAIRQLAYGLPADALDESFKMAESTALECLRRFCAAVIAVFGEEYLRTPNEADVKRLLEEERQEVFPECLYLLTFIGKEETPTIILKAVPYYDLWIWHAFFGLSGSLNDINVLDRSQIFNDLADGKGQKANYSVNGNTYSMGYCLTDGIYPTFATFVKCFNDPKTAKEKLFSEAQESVRKDVERAFVVLQSRFAIVAGPARMWNQKSLHDIMTTCFILHNMIVKCERENGDGDEIEVQSHVFLKARLQ